MVKIQMKTQNPTIMSLLEGGVALHADVSDGSSLYSQLSLSQHSPVLGSQWHISTLTRHVLHTQHHGVSPLLNDPRLEPSIDLSITAPVLKDVSIKYHEQPFDGNFMEENDFRKNGSAKVDEAWESLGVDCMCSPLEQHFCSID
jgi:hypothetical protein